MDERQFFRATRHVESVSVASGGTLAIRSVETIPGSLAKRYASPSVYGDKGTTLGVAALRKLETAITPQDWMIAVELCARCRDVDAMEYALGKLATQNHNTWWCCLHSMLPARYLNEFGSDRQRRWIQRATSLAETMHEYIRCAEAMVYSKTSKGDVLRTLSKARELDPDAYEYDVYDDNIKDGTFNVGPDTIFSQEYPFVGPPIK